MKDRKNKIWTVYGIVLVLSVFSVYGITLQELLAGYNLNYNNGSLTVNSVTEYGLNTNLNPLKDILVINVSMTNNADNYTIIAALKNGQENIHSHVNFMLPAATNIVPIVFNSTMLNKDNYVLSLKVYAGQRLVYRDDNQKNISITPAEYEASPIVEITDDIAFDSGSPADYEGFYLNLSMDVTAAGVYDVYVYLNESVYGNASVLLAAGNNYVLVPINADKIKRSGAYSVEKIKVNGLSYIKDYLTKQYDINDFDHGISMIREVSDSIEAGNLKLNIDIFSNFTGSQEIKFGVYTLYGELIYSYNSTFNLNQGVNNVIAYVPGAAIYNSKLNGPYKIDDHITAMYRHDDFKKPNLPDLEIKKNDIVIINSSYIGIADINVTVHNIDNGAAVGVSVMLFNESFDIIKEKMLHAVPAFNNVVAEFLRVNLSHTTKLYVYVDYENKIDEENESNNLVVIDFDYTNIIPEANASANITNGTLPLYVKFYGSGNGNMPLKYYWDFDNDGIVDSNIQDPTYTYYNQGIYNANLTVEDDDGERASDLVVIYAYHKLPAASDVSITPSPAYTKDNLTGSYNFDDVNDSSYYAWYVNGNKVVESRIKGNLSTYYLDGGELVANNFFASNSFTGTWPYYIGRDTSFWFNNATLNVQDDYIAVNFTKIVEANYIYLDAYLGAEDTDIEYSFDNVLWKPLIAGIDTRQCENDSICEYIFNNTKMHFLRILFKKGTGYGPQREWVGVKRLKVENRVLLSNDNIAKGDQVVLEITPNNRIVNGSKVNSSNINVLNSKPRIMLENQTLLEEEIKWISLSQYSGDADDEILTYNVTDENFIEVDCNIINNSWLQVKRNLGFLGTQYCTIEAKDQETYTNSTFWVEVVSSNVPVANASANSTSGMEPFNVRLTGEFYNGDAPFNFYWDFENDGIVDSTDQNVTHMYNYGTYNANFTVVDKEGERSFSIIVIDVLQDTVPTFTVNPSVSSGDESLFVMFNAVPYGNSPFTYAWDFNDDGAIDSTDQTASFVFAQNKTYTVRLNVTDAQGDIGFNSSVIVVNDLNPDTAIVGDSTIFEGNNATFDASMSSSAPDTIVKYEWDFSYDGVFNPELDTGLDPGAVRNFLNPGTYNIAVRVWDSDGSYDIATHNLSVQRLPDLSLYGLRKIMPFNSTIESMNVFEFKIKNNGDGTISNIAWSVDTGEDVMFNSGIILNGGNEIFVYAYHNYSIVGEYNVTATVDFNNTLMESDEDNNDDMISVVIG